MPASCFTLSSLSVSSHVLSACQPPALGPGTMAPGTMQHRVPHCARHMAESAVTAIGCPSRAIGECRRLVVVPMPPCSCSNERCLAYPATLRLQAVWPRGLTPLCATPKEPSVLLGSSWHGRSLCLEYLDAPDGIDTRVRRRWCPCLTYTNQTATDNSLVSPDSPVRLGRRPLLLLPSCLRP